MQINLEMIRPAAATLIIAFLTVLMLGPMVIARLRILKFGQNINTDAPERHGAKQGTPTMGGVLIVGAVGIALAAGLALSHLRVGNGALGAVFIVFAGHAVLGFLDDYLKAKRKRSLGLLARQKLLGQFLISVAFVLWLWLTSTPNFTTVVTLWHNVHFDLGYGYYVLAALWVIGISNAGNLTDGLDGLAAGLSVLVALGLSWTVYTYAAGFEQLPLFGYAVAGACLGFLWYNAHPASVFMGDTGSLALGSSFAAMAIVGKQEILVLILGAVFIAEMASVIIQVGVFKATGGKGKGRRVFRMAPLHHHFEQLGWPETHVVARFWIAGALALAVGLLCAPYLSAWVMP